VVFVRLKIGEYTVVDDEICYGKLTFKGTRVLVGDVLELLAAGVSIEEIVKDYYPGLSEEMVGEALERAAEIVKG